MKEHSGWCTMTMSPSFECLLEKDGSFSVHDSNIQSIAIEMFKVFKNLHTGNEHELFSRNDNEHFLR